jgi:hypothetical protein
MWKGITVLAAVIAVGGQSSVTAQTITPDQYHAQAGPCACPDDHKRDGRRCGHDSAYCRCGGLEPLCYAGDDQGQRESNRRRECKHVC